MPGHNILATAHPRLLRIVRPSIVPDEQITTVEDPLQRGRLARLQRLTMLLAVSVGTEISHQTICLKISRPKHFVSFAQPGLFLQSIQFQDPSNFGDRFGMRETSVARRNHEF